MGLAILGIGLIVIAVWGAKNPFAGLLGLILVNIIQPGELYDIFNTLHVERILFIIIGISTFAHNYSFSLPPISRNILYVLAAMVASVPLSIWRSNSITMIFTFMVIVALTILIVVLVQTEAQFKALIVTYVAGCLWLAGSSTYAYYQGQLFFAQGIERAVGLTSSGNNPNSLGITLVSGMPLAALIVMDKSYGKLLRLFGAAVICASIWTVIITGSRTAFAAMLLLFLMAIFSRKKNLVFLPVVVAIALTVWAVMPEQYVQRYESMNKLEKDESYQNRILAWKAGVAMFLDRPITGIGTGNFANAAGEEYWPGTGRKHWLNAHSLFFQTIGELGLVGLIAFLSFLISLFRLDLRLNRELDGSKYSFALRAFPVACMLSLCVLLVTSYSSHTLYRSTWYVFAAFSGVLGKIVAPKPEEVPTSANDLYPPAEASAT